MGIDIYSAARCYAIRRMILGSPWNSTAGRAMKDTHRFDKLGRRLPIMYCSCGEIVHGNVGCARHRARHRRINDGHCVVTAEQFHSLMQAKQAIAIEP